MIEQTAIVAIIWTITQIVKVYLFDRFNSKTQNIITLISVLMLGQVIAYFAGEEVRTGVQYSGWTIAIHSATFSLIPEPRI